MASRTASAVMVLTILALPSMAAPLPSDSSLKWEECPRDVLSWDSRVECGYLSVPLDWDAAQPGDITIGLAKLPARDPTRKIGNIFVQPGGPGIAGSSTVNQMANGSFWIADGLLDRFDIIGVDVRGTALSSRVQCDADLYARQLPMYPTTDAAFQERLSRNMALRQSCLELTGSPLIDYMDTASIAKDFEAVRIALGNEPMNWFGISYGTLVGSQYAELFPDNIRSIVLDGAVSVSQSETSVFMTAATSSEATFRTFLDWCARQNETACPMAHYGDKPIEKVWIDLVAQVEETPLPCSAERCLNSVLTASELLSSTVLFTYSEANWPALAEALDRAVTQNEGSGFAGNIRRPDLEEQPYASSQTYAMMAVSCQDWLHGSASAEDVRLKEKLGSQAPLLKGASPAYSVFQLDCMGWPPTTRNPPHAISIPETERFPTVLLVESIYDPATSLAWGVQLREEIGKDRTVFTMKNMSGHLVYQQPSSIRGEAAAAIEQYFVNLTLPQDGTVFQT